MRKTARGQSLSAHEEEFLATLSPFDLRVRVRDLFSAGWPLRAIQEALPIKRSRATLHEWATRTTSDSLSTPTPAPKERDVAPKRVQSPGVSDVDSRQIRVLAQSARQYRSRHPENHPYARANRDLTEIVTALYEQGVRIQEIADVACVSYRAIYKRIKLS